jgi:hypothetical protein
VLVTIGLTIRAVQNVNLVGAIRFLWVILWVIPLQVRRNCGNFNQCRRDTLKPLIAISQVFWTIGLFDYFQVTPLWIKFWWRDRKMAWFRGQFCYPGTADTLCAVPVFVDDANTTVSLIRLSTAASEQMRQKY